MPRRSNACSLVTCSGHLALLCAGRKADHLVAPSVSFGACRICAEEIKGISAVFALIALAVKLTRLWTLRPHPLLVGTTGVGVEWSRSSNQTARDTRSSP